LYIHVLILYTPRLVQGIAIEGNDHYVTNSIVFSALIGVKLTGAANILNGVHTWNCETSNGEHCIRFILAHILL
jgi:hypothetical protein